ncbi:MAG: hypothetical protein KGZ61_07325, partial [Sandarakinorhabdus sp.]|nr:hypothetical protein [Sandarakinorhabdus sp.]
MKPAPALPIAAAASIEVGLNAAGDGAPITRVQLLPIGQVHLRDGRGPFLLPPEHASAVVEATRRKAGRTAIMIDYDHQSFYGAKDGVGGRAPAAGWIDPASLSVDATGIWGTVEWTPAAGQRLKAREYRYLSPLFSYDEKTKIVSSILNAGLTNTPAIEALAAVASEDRSSLQENAQMDYSKIAAALGLADTATEEEVMAKIASLTASMADMTTAASVQAAVV